jgi:TetR/AcrR family transcriptional repressor of nem operon
MTQPSRGPRKAASPDVAERIEAVATRLFILHGYNGVSYLDIARELGVTHSSIHYYYRSKAILAEAVLRRVSEAMLEAMRRIWTNRATRLLDKFVETRDWIHGQYLLSNPQGRGGQPWGLLSRFTADAEALTLTMRRLIRSSVGKLEEYIDTGVAAEAERGGLVDGAPRDGIALQIASLLLISGQITRQASGFDRLDALMRWTHTTIDRAYSAMPERREWPPLPDVRSAPRGSPVERPSSTNSPKHKEHP